MPNDPQSLPLYLCLVNTPGWTQKTLWDARDYIWVGCMQGKCPNSCSIILVLFPSFSAARNCSFEMGMKTCPQIQDLVIVSFNFNSKQQHFPLN